jgi:hypothetical protein
MRVGLKSWKDVNFVKWVHVFVVSDPVYIYSYSFIAQIYSFLINNCDCVYVYYLES